MRTPEEITQHRTKMKEHLEAALALADETGDSTDGYMSRRRSTVFAPICGPGI